MSEAIICEGCGRYVDNKHCKYFGVEIRAVGCDVFLAKEPAKPVEPSDANEPVRPKYT